MNWSIQEYNNILDIETFARFFLIFGVVSLIILLIYIVELYYVFKKFNQKGWKAFIPIYNTWIYLKISDLPGWLQFIPVANIIGMLVAPFIIAKKSNKTALLGLLGIILPPLFYLIIIFSKETSSPAKEDNQNSNIEELNNNISAIITENNIEKNEELEEIKEERIPEFIEEPALNTAEPEIKETNALKNTYVNIEPNNKKIIDEDITNAFEIPFIKDSNFESERKKETLTTITNNDYQDFVNSGEPLMPTHEELESLDLNENKEEQLVIDKDILEETLELPKMANEEINSGITATKKCNNCGFENIYSSKTCLMCGEELE